MNTPTLTINALALTVDKNDFNDILLYEKDLVSFSSHFQRYLTDDSVARYLPTGQDLKYMKQVELFIDNLYVVRDTKDILKGIMNKDGTLDIAKLNKKTQKTYHGYILLHKPLTTKYPTYFPHFCFVDVSKCVKKVSLLMKQESKERYWISVVPCRKFSVYNCILSDTCMWRNNRCSTYSKYQVQPLKNLNLVMKPYKYYMFTEFQVNNIKTVFKMDSKHIHPKPFGFWFAVGDEWIQHMKKTNFWMNKYNYLYELELNKSDVIVIDTLALLHEFSFAYGETVHYKEDHFTITVTPRVNWNKFIKDTSAKGIIISPNFKKLYYKYSYFNDKHSVFWGAEWYLRWDIASGAIWDTTAISDMKIVYAKENGNFVPYNTRKKTR